MNSIDPLLCKAAWFFHFLTWFIITVTIGLLVLPLLPFMRFIDGC